MRNPPSSEAVKSGGSKPTPCCTKIGLKRGPWTPEEDELLANFVRTEGEGRWRTFPKRAGLLRCGKSCRLRWMNYLRPSVKRGHIAPDEEDLILRLHRLLGNRWSLIAGRIPGRTDNEIKNYWNTHLSKKLISQGIDPRTHKPLVDTSNINTTNNNSDTVVVVTRKKHSKGVSLSENVPPTPNPVDITSYLSDETNSGVIADLATQTAPPQHFSFSFDPVRNNNSYQNLNGNGFMNTNPSPGSLELDEESDPNYCSEDVFSSFLNSLINEDLYPNQAQQQILPQHEGLLLAHPAPSDAALGFGAVGWIAPLMSTAQNTLPEDHDQLQ